MSKYIIFKSGSAELINSDGKILFTAVEKLVELCRQAQALSLKPVLVVSGAVALGKNLLMGKTTSRGAAAALGQSAITQAFTLAGAVASLNIGQILCSTEESYFSSSLETIKELCSLSHIPLVNENDAANFFSHQFGNNDQLAASIAITLQADLVCFFSSIGGVYLDFCSRSGCGNCLLEECPDCPLTEIINAKCSTSLYGSGGMLAKCNAIDSLREARIASFVGALSATSDLMKLLSGKVKGTRSGSIWKEFSSRQVSTDVTEIHKVIDLRSDTVSQPNLGMRLAMSQAIVGDDCYLDDPSVLDLQEQLQNLLGVEETLFIASGTMKDQVALRALTEPGDEVITHAAYHLNFFESAQTADLARVTLNCSHSVDGFLSASEVKKALSSKPRGAFYAQAPVVWIENTVAATGGSVFPLSLLEELSTFCRKEGLHLHLDGARLFNAVAADGKNLNYYAELVDSLTICLSKGLGAPFGSVLAGKPEFIKRAKKYRKWFGGGFHQAGIMAAGASFALRNNMSNFAQDHLYAELLRQILAKQGQLKCKTVESNMLFFDVSNLQISATQFVKCCADWRVLLFPWSENIVRAVTHYNLSESEIHAAGKIICLVADQFNKSQVVHERISLPN